MARDKRQEKYGDFSRSVFHEYNNIIYPREDVSNILGYGTGFLKPFGIKVK